PGRPGYGPKLVVDHFHDFALELEPGLIVDELARIAHDHESHCDLALQLIGHSDDRDLRHIGMAGDALFDLACSQPVAGDVDHVIGTTEDEEITVFVADTPVERAVEHLAGDVFPIGLDVALVIAPDGLHEARRRRPGDHHHALFIGPGQLFARGFVHQFDVIAVHRQPRAA